MLLVTHDLEEAIILSDRVYLLSQGPRARITQQYQVPIPRPRDPVKARVHPAFAPLYEKLWNDLSHEVDFRPRRGRGMNTLEPRFAWIRQIAAFRFPAAALGGGRRRRAAQPAVCARAEHDLGRALCSCSRTAASGRIWRRPFPPPWLGLALGIVVGIVLGVVAALVPPIAELLEPVMTLLNAIPRVVLAPLFVIWLGIDLASKVALAFILVAVVIFFTVYCGIRQVDRKLVERVVTLGGGRWELVRHVYLPSVAAWVLGNLKVVVGFAFTGACVGEFVGASRGLGYLLSFAQSTYNAALMFALIFLIMVVVLAIFRRRRAGWKRYLLRWQ